MINKTCKAWFIRKIPSGDSSLRVLFFTAEFGLIYASYRGGRAPKKQVALQPFIPLWISFNTRKQWHFLNQVELTGASPNLCSEVLFSALYANELISLFLKPDDPAEALFQGYEATINALTANPDRLSIERILRRFEWVLLCECGYEFSLDFDCHSQQAITEQFNYQFVAGKGFIQSQQGAFSGSDLMRIKRGDLEESTTLKVAKQIMRKAIEHALDGREVKTRQLFSSRRAMDSNLKPAHNRKNYFLGESRHE